MATAQMAGLAGNPRLGKGLMVMGTLIFVAEILYGVMQGAITWGFSGHAGWLAAAAIELLRLVNGIAWNHTALVTGSLEMLVLCLPLALVALGAKLIRNPARERN
jgi:hypothetical protein